MTVSATLAGVLLKGTAAARPAANAVAGGTLYSATDTGAISQSDGSSWSAWATIAAGAATDTIYDAKGDIAAGTGADTAARLPVGADDTILMADSGQSTGLKWVASATPSTQAFGDAAAAGTGDTFTRGDHKHAMPANPTVGLVSAIEFVIDGGGSALTTGIKGYLEVPFACTITQATLLADVSGSVVVNVYKDTYANYPPVVGDKITASAPPTISSATKSQDSTLTGWTTSISAGDILAFNVDSATTITRVTISLKVTRT